jgi:hypothetical protein
MNLGGILFRAGERQDWRCYLRERVSGATTNKTYPAYPFGGIDMPEFRVYKTDWKLRIETSLERKFARECEFGFAQFKASAT